jgi:hypothetical protein
VSANPDFPTASDGIGQCMCDAAASGGQDDIWSALKLERCLAAMLNDPTVILVHHVREGVFDCHKRQGSFLRRTRTI